MIREYVPTHRNSKGNAVLLDRDVLWSKLEGSLTSLRFYEIYAKSQVLVDLSWMNRNGTAADMYLNVGID